MEREREKEGREREREREGREREREREGREREGEREGRERKRELKREDLSDNKPTFNCAVAAPCSYRKGHSRVRTSVCVRVCICIIQGKVLPKINF